MTLRHRLATDGTHSRTTTGDDPSASGRNPEDGQRIMRGASRPKDDDESYRVFQSELVQGVRPACRCS